MSTKPQFEIERPLPNSVETERAFLGAIVLDNRALAAAQDLSLRDFFLPQHRLIFGAMLSLRERSPDADIEPTALLDELQKADKLEAAGGMAYLSQLADGLPRVTNVAHYVQIIRERSALRALIHSCEEIKDRAFFARTGDAAAVVAQANERIAGLLSRVKLSSEPADWMGMFHTFEEFENCPPLSFAIEGFLQNHGCTMIGGLSGHGKTLMLISIVKALLAGKGARLWDFFPVRENAVRVVYLIPECSIEPFKHRLKLFGIYDCLRPEDGRLLVRTLSKGPTPCLSDPKILFAAKGAHVILDTAARFSEGEENSAEDNMRGLATDIFRLLEAGARTVQAAHHSPKAFSRENTMRLENVLRGTGDIGAMLTTAWGIKELDSDKTVIHVENLKARDFRPFGPFQIIGRPYIDDEGDFRLHRRSDECGSLQDEQQPDRDRGGAPDSAREARSANIELLRQWIRENPLLSSTQLSRKFRDIGITIGDSAIRKYKKHLGI